MKNSLRFASTLLAIILSACSLSSWVTYTNTTYPFQLDYPSDGSLESDTSNAARIQLPFQSGTTLYESFLDIFVNPGAMPCLSPYSAPYAYPPGSMVTGVGIFAGYQWVIERGVESTGDLTREWVAYSSTFEEICVSLTFVLRSKPLLILPPYDKDTEELLFQNIVDTFIWYNPTLTPMLIALPTRTFTPTPMPIVPPFPTPTSAGLQFISSPTPTAMRYEPPTFTPQRYIPPTPTPTPMRYEPPTPTPTALRPPP